MSFDLLIPKLRIDATYNLKGNILLLPIVGSGNVAMSMKDVKSSVYTKISIRKKPEVCLVEIDSCLSLILPNFTEESLNNSTFIQQEVIHIEEMKVTFLVGTMRIHLDNLFNGNKVLGASLNMFLNQNAKEGRSNLCSLTQSSID